MIREFDHCPCCKRRLRKLNGETVGKPCKVDGFGHHFASACMKDVKGDNGHMQGVQPHAIHDGLRSTLHRIAKHAMARSIEEDQHVLYTTEPATPVVVQPPRPVVIANGAEEGKEEDEEGRQPLLQQQERKSVSFVLTCL